MFLQKSGYQDLFVVGFIATDFLCQIAVFLLGDTSLRLPLRITTYASSLGLLLCIRGAGKLHPSRKWVNLIAVTLVVGGINVEGDSLLSRVAQISLYLSVLAPVIWITRIGISRLTFRRIALMMWFFYVSSSLLGVLQVRYPGRFDGAMTANYDKDDLAKYIVKLSDGTIIFRPKGLSDTPGGAAFGGVNAIILGCGLLLTSRKTVSRAIAVVGMVSGSFCIYLSQIRTDLLLVLLATVAIAWALRARRDSKRTFTLIVFTASVGFIGTIAAFVVGGDTTIARFSTLTENAPGEVYYNNRGRFLEDLVKNDVFLYPVGAGEGRWGMMSMYFGRPEKALWAEMTWQGLLYDGGIPLILLYACFLGSVLTVTYRICKQAFDPIFGTWATVVFGYTIAAVAASFDFPLLSGQMGLEVMLLNAALFSASVQTPDVIGPRSGRSGIWSSRSATRIEPAI